MQKQTQNRDTKENKPNSKESRRRLEPYQKAMLPFNRRPLSAAEWSYNHKEAICITLIAYLLLGVIFVGSKIEISSTSTQDSIVVDFSQERKIELTPEQIEQLRILEQYGYDDFSDVSNLASNQNMDFGQAQSTLSRGLSDDRATNISELYADAGALDGDMADNRAAYEAGLARDRAMRDNNTAGRGSTGGAQNEASQQSENVRVKGRVTVSFSFTDPVRNSLKLVVPAYLCEGGGEVTVIATLDNNGYVVSASVDRSHSSSDSCMQETAIRAARGSRFNLDSSAPSRHQGTITYTFIPQ